MNNNIAQQKNVSLQQQLEVLTSLLEEVGTERSFNAIVQRVTDVATELTRAQFGAFFYNVINAKGESYQLYTISGVPREAFSKFPMPRNTKIFHPTFSGERTVRSDDITLDPNFGKNSPYHGMPKGHLPVRSYLAIPVKSKKGEVIGGLFFGHEKTAVFNEEAEKLGVAIASLAAVAMENNSVVTKLHESEHRMHLAVEATGLGTWDFNPLTGELVWSRQCKLLFGMQPDMQVDYQTFLKAIHHEDRKEVDDAVQRALDPETGGNFSYTYRTVGLNDGKVRFVKAMGKAFFEDGIAYRFIGTVLDITEQKKQQEALEKERNRFFNLLMSLPAFIAVTTGRDHRYELANDAYKKLLKDEGIIGKPVIEGLPELAGYEIVEVLDSVFQSGESFTGREVEILFDRGDTNEQQPAYFNFTYQPFSDFQGNIEGIILIGYEVTDQVMSRRTVEEFMSIASHELKTPLATSFAYAQLLEDVMGKHNNPQERTYFKRLMNHLQKLNALISDLLDVSRIQTGKMKFEKQEFDFDSFIQDIVKDIQVNAPNHKIILTGKAGKKIVGDKQRLEQALSNIINNAVKYSPGADEVLVNVEAKNTHIITSIIDRGVGISKQQMPHLFQRFYRIDERNTKIAGLGIGLYITKTIIDNHQGEIKVESKQKEGSTFTVLLPQAQ